MRAPNHRNRRSAAGSNKRLRIKIMAYYPPGAQPEGWTPLDAGFLDLSAASTGVWNAGSVTLTYVRTGVEDDPYGRTPRVEVWMELLATEVTAGAVEIDYCQAEIIG